MNWVKFNYLLLKNRIRHFNRNESGATDVSNVMWIAVGVLILVAVVSLVAVFWDSLVGKVNEIDPDFNKDSVKNIGGSGN